MIIANTWTLRVLCSEFETPALKRRAQAFAHGLVQIDQCLDMWLNTAFSDNGSNANFGARNEPEYPKAPVILDHGRGLPTAKSVIQPVDRSPAKSRNSGTPSFWAV
jgi:hypothetical protein